MLEPERPFVPRPDGVLEAETLFGSVYRTLLGRLERHTFDEVLKELSK